MADDQRRGEGEELFEDLDKFFAPIQDVDWPEPSEPVVRVPDEEREIPRDPKEGAEPTAAAPSEPGAAGEPEPARGSRVAVEAEDAEPPVEHVVAATDAEDEDEEIEAEGGVGSFLFETEAEAEEYEPVEAAPAGSYVELPGAEDVDAAEVAELEEGDDDAVDEPAATVAEEAPDLEAVEAAADHFAESVRDEVRIEPEPPTTEPTEEVAIAALLGGEEGAAPEIEPATVRVGAEGFGGPSWQEPTTIEVGAESERKGPGRDVPTAFLTGVILVALAVGAILLGPGPFAILAGLVVLFALGEFYLAIQKRGYQPATALGLVSGALVLGAGYFRGENAMLAIMALSIFATFLWYMTVPAPRRRNLVSNIAITVLGVAYIPLLAAYALAVLKLPDGEGLTLSIIGLTFVYDTAAFAVGFFWGSRPLAPTISPKKSWEGAIGATLVVIAVAVGVVAPSVSLLDTVGRSAGLAVVVALFAPLGDLAESLLKRDLGIKDMGGILPGHGGVMDRIDSVLFVAPAAFIYLRLILL
ncbi:MAG: phosphatidate cytidylyltransferase [Actinobacteria bacterium]|nr:phosphatidate cytidylyltransferase [Actinomycetota bacterium]